MNTLSFKPLTEHIGAQVDGIDIQEPLGPKEVEAIHAGMDRYAVLVIKRQPITAQQQLNFTKSLGELERSIGTSLRAADDYRLPTTFADVSNLDKNNRPFDVHDRRRLFAIGNRLWHSDSSFKAVPAKYSILHGLSKVSRGGETDFAHMGIAHETLDERTRDEVCDLICEHSQMYSRAQIGFTDFTAEEQLRFKPVRQALVRTLPRTGRRSLYLSSHAGRIVGWTVQDSLIFLKELIEHATQPSFVYRHRWAVGDTVIWDNRQTMHRARRFPAEESRDMRRTTLAGEGPTAKQVEQTNIAQTG